MQFHRRISIVTDHGAPAEAVAPIIISASRSTDIPAFYGSWFINRLAAGYVRWVNPWNGRSSYVSLREARLIVFWTKNPAPFLPLLKQIDRRGIPYYFHFTLNDYESEGLERGVPPFPERIETFKRLAAMIGRERVLWRFDPLITTESLGPEQLMVRICRIGDQLAEYTERLTISFMTEYVKVKRNLRNAGITSSGWNSVNKAALLSRLAEKLVTWNIRGVTCAGGGSTNELFGIQKGKCIDDGLARRLWGNDESLMRFLNAYAKAKDKGQRPDCRCIPSKDIGRYDTCGHECCYCYANASPRAAFDNRTAASNDTDAIIGQL